MASLDLTEQVRVVSVELDLRQLFLKTTEVLQLIITLPLPFYALLKCNSVADPELQISGGPDHPDFGIRGGPALKNIFFLGPTGLYY